jgi:hypothetical protein
MENIGLREINTWEMPREKEKTEKEEKQGGAERAGRCLSKV